MTLPIDRTAKSTLDANLVNGITSDAPAIKASDDVVYNAIDELYNYTSGLVAGGVVSPYPPSNFNKLINGNFDVWQRGTSFAIGTGTLYTADRWKAYRGSLVSGMTVSRQDGSGVYGSKYCLRAQRDSGNVSVNTLTISQVLESFESQKLRGKKVTMSFYARMGANYSPASSYLNFTLSSGTGTDESGVGTITGGVTQINSNFTLTTSWQKFTVTLPSALADTVNQLFLFFFSNPTGTAGTNDYFEISQAQLNVGDTALPFQPKSFAEELISCRRYLKSLKNSSYRMSFYTANALQFATAELMNMRVIPTLVNNGIENTDWLISTLTGGSVLGFALNIFGSAHLQANKTSHGLTDATLVINDKVFLDA